MTKPIVIALLLLTLGNLFVAFYDVTIKWLPSDTNPTSFLLLRQLIAVIMLLPVWFFDGCPQTTSCKIHLYRSYTGSICALCLVIGYMALPISVVSSIFNASPLIIMVLGFLLLKEKITKLQWLITVVGFVGVLIILRPGEVNYIGFIVLFAAVLFAINQLKLRQLPKSESASTTVICYNLLSLPLMFLVVIFQGVKSFSWELVGFAFLSNSFLLGYHYFCVLAYRKAKVSEIAVAEYSGLIFVITLGWLLFDEHLDALTWFGISLVVMPSILMHLKGLITVFYHPEIRAN